MPKLDRETVRTREAFVEQLVSQNPKISLADLNDQLKAQFKHRMRTDRLGELREAARLKAKRATPAAAPTVRAKRTKTIEA